MAEFEFSERYSEIYFEREGFLNKILKVKVYAPPIEEQNFWSKNLNIILGNLSSDIIRSKGYKEDKEKISVKSTKK